MNAQERILYVLEKIHNRPTTAKELCYDIFESTEANKIRLIQKDIKLLKDQYPNSIEKTGEHYILLKLPDFMQTLMESNTDDLVELFEFITLFDAKMIDLFEQKEPVFVKKLKKEIRSMYHIQDDPIESIGDKDIWRAVKKAVRQKRYISIGYKKDKLHAYNDIRPVKIIFARNNWYLAAINTEEKHDFDFTFFRINHITSVSFEEKNFKEDFEALKHLENLQSLFERYRVERYKVKVLVKPEVAPYFKNKKYLRSQQIEQQNEDGSLILSFSINNTMELLPIVKRWMPHMIVQEPQHLKNEIEEIVSTYLKLI